LKKQAFAILTAAIIFMTACGSSSAVKSSSSTVKAETAATAAVSETESVMAETGDSESGGVSADEGQNPVMNIIGPYADKASGKASMVISCEGTDGASIVIDWKDSAASVTEWQIHGTYDSDKDVVNYKNAVKTVKTYDSKGKETDEVKYSDGTGTITVGENNTLTWKDNKEDAGKGCEFVFSN